MGKKTENETGKRYYIAYGSNMNLPQMARRCPTAKRIGVGEVEGYELLFRGGRKSSVATIEPKEGSSVPVLAWELQGKDEYALDLYEGYPRFYRKENLELELNGEHIQAMVYIMNDGHAIGTPSDTYYNCLKEGYRTAGIPQERLDEAVEKSQEMSRMQSEPQVQWGM